MPHVKILQPAKHKIGNEQQQVVFYTQQNNLSKNLIAVGDIIYIHRGAAHNIIEQLGESGMSLCPW